MGRSIAWNALFVVLVKILFQFCPKIQGKFPKFSSRKETIKKPEMSKLRIKVDCASKVQWMFFDLKSIKTILDLSARIKERYSVEELFLSLDDAVLPDTETIEILNNGDLIKVNLKKNAKKSNGKICQSKSSSSSSSSSNSSSEDEVRHFKQSSKGTAHIPEKTASPRKITI